MSKIISISSHKGGVGKTTSTINIGAGLNQLGKKVLLIDLDPQANLSLSLGLTDKNKSNIYGVLRGDYKIDPIEIVNNLFVVPSVIDLSAVEIMEGKEREQLLKKLLDSIKKEYDYILIDTPPSLGLLTINSFVASDFILVPLQAQYLALQGLSKLLEIIDKMNKHLNKKLQLGGVFITQYDSRKILNKDIVTTIEGYFKNNEVFKTKIRDNVALAEAPASGLDIFRYNSKSNGGEDYLNLSKEILEKINN